MASTYERRVILIATINPIIRSLMHTSIARLVNRLVSYNLTLTLTFNNFTYRMEFYSRVWIATTQLSCKVITNMQGCEHLAWNTITLSQSYYTVRHENLPKCKIWGYFTLSFDKSHWQWNTFLRLIKDKFKIFKKSCGIYL